MRILEWFFVFILFLQIISAQCNEGQIDINSATKEELENLPNIGPVKAQAIIDARPFNSIDELIRVKGIGNITLNKIKAQGLVCINIPQKNQVEKKNEIIDDEKTNKDEKFNVIIPQADTEENIEQGKIEPSEPIILRQKKEENNYNEDYEKKEINYSVHGIVAFLIFIIIMLFLKSKKQRRGFE